MEKTKIDRIIEAFRHSIQLKEDAMVVGTGGFTGSSDPKGPVAGFDPVMGFVKRRRKKIIGLGKGSRNRWKPSQP